MKCGHRRNTRRCPYSFGKGVRGPINAGSSSKSSNRLQFTRPIVCNDTKWRAPAALAVDALWEWVQSHWAGFSRGLVDKQQGRAEAPATFAVLAPRDCPCLDGHRAIDWSWSRHASSERGVPFIGANCEPRGLACVRSEDPGSARRHPEGLIGQGDSAVLDSGWANLGRNGRNARWSVES